MHKAILKNTPFGYKNSKELFEKLISTKYSLISKGTLENYYDFIFVAGALRDWLINEFNLSKQQVKNIFLKDKFFSIFHSIYNNSKHYKLDNAQEYYIILDGKATGKTNENGEVVATHDTIFYSDEYFLDKISGEDGNSNFFCTIKNNKNSMIENIYLYEICKQVYNKYNSLITDFYNNI